MESADSAQPDRTAFRGRLPSLDGWRAVAVFLVLASHFQFARNFPDSLLATAIVSAFDGNLGVRMFFGISGFLITLLLLKEEQRDGTVSLKAFYGRRCLRILPVYCAYLVVLAVLSITGRYYDNASSWIGSLSFTRNILGRGNSASVHFWSLAIEEQFYLCWPAAFKILKLSRHQRRAVGLLILVVFAANATRVVASFYPSNLALNPIWGARSIFRYADSLAIGCIAAYVFTSNPLRFTAAARLLAWTVLLTGLCLDQFCSGFGLIKCVVPTIQEIAFCWILLESVMRPNLYAALNIRFVTIAGLMSYSLYVWQMIYLQHFAPLAVPSLLQDWRVWWIPAVLTGCLSYALIERPMNALRSRLKKT